MLFRGVCHFCGGCKIVCPNHAIVEKDYPIGSIHIGKHNSVVVKSGIMNTGEESGVFGVEAFADCDVDAPNLHLIESRSKEPYAADFYGSKKAVIDKSKCIFCGTCASNCRFDSIKLVKSKYVVNEYACEGCGVCEYVCPAKAIHLEDAIAGKLMLYKDDFTFSTAELKMGRGNSGKLVMAVKKQLDKNSDIRKAIDVGKDGIEQVPCLYVVGSTLAFSVSCIIIT